MNDDAVTVPGLVRRAARRFPDRDSFVFPEVRQTYVELETSAVEVARSLTALGVTRGDLVGAVMPNCLEFAHAMLGASMIGATFVPINARLAPRELAYVIADSGIKVLTSTDVVDEHVDFAARLTQAFPELGQAESGSTPSLSAAPALRHVVMMGERSAPGFVTRDSFLELGSVIDPDEIRATADALTPETPYVMMYTSGTTSMPKGCPLSHESVVRLGKGLGEEAFRMTETDRMWNPLPMFHVSAQAPMMGVLNAAAAYVSMAHFEPTAALELIDREKATLLYPAYPTLTGPLLNHPSYHSDTFRRVRAMLTVGPPDVLRDYQEKLPHTVHVSCYGSTETGGVAVMGRLTDAPAERFTSGRPFSGVEAEVCDLLTDKKAPVGETGMLYIRGFNLFQGYRNDPEKTAEAFDTRGWFCTGDLASIDDNGNLTFRGRSKDMLKVGGENVGCVELETYLATHPDIQLAYVVGVPDPKYDEVPAAFVECHPEATLTEHEVIDYCRAGLAKYKVPRFVRFTSDWPMSATKVQKFRLRDRLLNELSMTESDSG